MRVLVIGGGISDERDVSLRSAQSIFRAIGEQHQKEFYDWDGGAEWLDLHLNEYDVVLPILHGEGGEDGQIQSILESRQAKYLGSDSRSSKICIDKEATQKVLKAQKILVPKHSVLTHEEYITSDLSLGRHVVKPVNGGSSLSTFIDVRAHDPRASQIKKAFNTYTKMMVEEFIAGTEVTVPVLDGKQSPLIEIVPPEGEFFDYNNKYNGQTKEICPSDNVSKEAQETAQKIAQLCHQALGCRHLSRVDMMIDSNGQIYTLEINTMPGMTDQSLFPKSASQVGMTMTALTDYFIELTAGQ